MKNRLYPIIIGLLVIAITTLAIQFVVVRADLNDMRATLANSFALKQDLSATGTINSPINPLDWTKLKNVPAGLADGMDDTGSSSGGTITSVVAGTGLSGGGNTGDVTLQLATNYASGSTYDNRFVNTSGDAITGSLTVSGTVSTTKVIYTSPHTHYYSIPAPAFSPSWDIPYSNDAAAYIYSGIGDLQAPVYLPHGAVVTSFKVFFRDYSSSDIDMNFYRIDLMYPIALSFPVMSVLANVSSAGISGFGSKTDSTINNSTIDNTQYGYYVRAESGSWNSDNLSVIGAVITYTISEAP
jgi:hypothetical protein